MSLFDLRSETMTVAKKAVVVRQHPKLALLIVVKTVEEKGPNSDLAPVTNVVATSLSFGLVMMAVVEKAASEVLAGSDPPQSEVV